ncbi:MAG: SDR family NAD(P)-dependent oxidoreductase, partial [Burkholderiales bacterium]
MAAPANARVNKSSQTALKGQVAWVVGGSGSLGKAIAAALVEAGARVIVSSRRTRTRWQGPRQNAAPSLLQIDLASSRSVNQAARTILR